MITKKIYPLSRCFSESVKMTHKNGFCFEGSRKSLLFNKNKLIHALGILPCESGCFSKQESWCWYRLIINN